MAAARRSPWSLGAQVALIKCADSKKPKKQNFPIDFFVLRFAFRHERSDSFLHAVQ
jgi:hypothetical protein